MTHYYVDFKSICNYMGVNLQEATYGVVHNMFMCSKRSGHISVDIDSFYKWAKVRGTAKRSYSDVISKYVAPLIEKRKAMEGTRKSNVPKIEYR